MLETAQVKLIRASALRLAEHNVAATNAFYASLFQVAPGVRPLFAEDMFEQSQKLWESIVTVVEGADDLDVIRDALRALGARHVHYGARPEHYPVVCDVLMQTVALVIGDDWSDSHHRAWKAALDAVSDTMLEGARQSAA